VLSGPSHRASAMPRPSRAELLGRDYALSIGSNVAPERHVPEALRRLRSLGRIEAVSSVYRTAPIGPVVQPDFHNLAVRLRTDLSPLFLLERCQSVERALGRVRAERWGPRCIDIDLLWCGPGCVVAHPRLSLPHPRLWERAFVVVPLLEVSAGLPPPLGQALGQAARALSHQKIEPLGPVAELYGTSLGT
jgi:2-amino-4-hydroxy-6-hydroxymethyldihydropteridine diphosphokinase